MTDREPAKTHWWHSAPVVLSAIAGLLTAITGLVVGLHQAGVIGGGGAERSAAAAAAPAATPSTATPAATLAAPAPSVAAAPPSGPPLTGPPGRNLLSPQNGGRLVAAPTKAWSSANDDVLAEGTTITFVDAFAIFGFQDDRPATFDRFGILVPKADENPATIEIAVGDAMTGPFRPLAKVQILNLYVAANDGWQYFDLPKTTARYVRITTSERPDHGVMGYLSELSLDEKPTLDEKPRTRSKDWR
ncbi:hypothetical protein ASD21_04930 [Caulobacter sp. Root1455]|uniref:hypothetical protein n=1 Tax=Caulobacter sp. Root1455 TaxID=1736465 RepID=UPI0006F6BD3E|nr:hypothetical protein [Caulobacter sp. Root1455]KQY95856.1 hypothetical protein ASD21_04930 [Caulobacter sp. Root1455]